MKDIIIRTMDHELTYERLYSLIHDHGHPNRLYHSLPLKEFESIMLNGITLVAYIAEDPVGFINFEILSVGKDIFCVQNIVYSVPGEREDEVMSLLAEQEYQYLKQEKALKYIVAKVKYNDKFTQAFMKRQGFVKVSVNRFMLKERSYVAIQYRKSMSSACSFEQIPLKSRLQLLFKEYLAYDRNGNDSIFMSLFKWTKQCKTRLLIRRTRKAHRQLIAEIKKRKKARVLFIASSVSMWKYDYLYKALETDPRFELYIVLSPLTYFSIEHQKQEMADMQRFFNAQGMDYISYNVEKPFLITDYVNPDIIFFCQPYSCSILGADIHNKLLAYYPYGYYIENIEMYYNSIFQEIAWKLFYSNPLQKEHAERYALNKGSNVVVTGYPMADYFQLHQPSDPWKPQPVRKKRVIWAPHFTINNNTCFAYHSNFMLLADFMLELAVEYKDRIQFAFKPHPRLKRELYANATWGQHKTDNYYLQWKTMENCQLEEGEFFDLFRTSDAMIHDSTSFCVDYLYTDKPVMYISTDLESYKSSLDQLGQNVMDLLYPGKTTADILDFIQNTVLSGNDPMKEQRMLFKQRYLLSPDGKTTAQKTMEDMVNTLFS